MNGIAYALEDEELFEDEEDFDDAFAESDELEDFLERRRRRRPRRIRHGKTGKGTGLFRPRPSGQYVTQTQLQAGLNRVGKQIQTNAESIKKVTAQANRINSELGATTTKLGKEVGELKKEVKKQAETSLLLTLLQPQPELETKNPAATVDNAGEVVGNVQIKRQSNLLPLVLLSSSGGLGGGDNNMLLLALAMSGQL